MLTTRIAARKRGLGLAALLAGAGGLGTGIAMAATPTAADTPGATMAVKKEDRRVRYREPVSVRGTVTPAAAGRPVTLEYAPLGGQFTPVAQTQSGPGGRYRATVRLRQSGNLRAVSSGAATTPEPVRVGAGVRVSARRHVKRGQLAAVRGYVRPAGGGRHVLVQVSRGRGWDTVARARTRAGGRFRVAWRARQAGSYRVRAVFTGDRRNAASSARARGRLNVYRPSQASWYGPGFYGGRTACGRTLGTGTLGVANKSLPCGTRVTFRYRGRTVTVPVIDRGPYVAGREWDLTGATKRALGFPSTGTVWTTR